MGTTPAAKIAILGALVLAASQVHAAGCGVLKTAINAVTTQTNTTTGGTVTFNGSGRSGIQLALVKAMQKALGATQLGLSANSNNRGFASPRWGTLVNSDGVVCAVALVDPSGVIGATGTTLTSSEAMQKGRLASATKAATAQGQSTNTMAFSSANLYAATQPGGSLYGMRRVAPVDELVAAAGPAKNYGRHNDPLVGKVLGGIDVLGGGLALYQSGKLVGGLGVGGDTPCSDHWVAWYTRMNLNLDPGNAKSGLDATQFATANNGFGTTTASAVWDNIIYDIPRITTNGALDTRAVNGNTSYFEAQGISASGYGHPLCLGAETPP